MNVPVISGLLGRFLITYASVMCIPLVLALFLREQSSLSFLLSVLITGFMGVLLFLRLPKLTSIKIGVREAFAAVAGIWVLASLTGSLPYWLANVVPTYFDALFETVSGLTTTGASVIFDVESLPKSILLWRSLTNWLGGMGIIIFFIVLLPKTGLGSFLRFNAEVPGPMNERLMPKIRDIVISLMFFYFTITLICTVLLWLAGMSFFDAVNHAFATIATGGFSTKNSNIMHFDSLSVELIITFFMIFAGTNFAIYLTVWHKKNLQLFRNTELIVYLLLIFTATVVIAGNLIINAGEAMGYAWRHALFQVASIVSTTGFASADFALWPSMGRVILFLLMFVAGCVGSTAGGIKISRFIMLAKTAWTELRRGIHPKAVSSIKLDGKVIDTESLNRVGVFFFLYIIVFASSSILMAGTGLKPFDAMSAVATTLGNVGPGFGVIGPTTTFAGITLFGKFILTICMLLGRLEFFTLLIIIRPDFWKKRRVW